jgi:hypothetical protein
MLFWPPRFTMETPTMFDPWIFHSLQLCKFEFQDHLSTLLSSTYLLD